MTRKDPAGTRAAILDAAFKEIHARGFRAASLTSIQRRAGVTRGAVYHHFASKPALAHAVVEELLGGRIRQFADELLAAQDPIAALRAWLLSPPWLPVELGCPVNNLVQEMSATDDGFRTRLERVFTDWRHAISEALRRGQRGGRVRSDVDAADAGTFILAALEGGVSLAKSAGSVRPYERTTRMLADYVVSLSARRGRAPRAESRGPRGARRSAKV